MLSVKVEKFFDEAKFPTLLELVTALSNGVPEHLTELPENVLVTPEELDDMIERVQKLATDVFSHISRLNSKVLVEMLRTTVTLEQVIDGFGWDEIITIPHSSEYEAAVLSRLERASLGEDD